MNLKFMPQMLASKRRRQEHGRGNREDADDPALLDIDDAQAPRRAGT